MDFGKVILKNVKKTFHNKHIYIYIPVIDILKFYEVLFCTYSEDLFCHYACIPPYMYKALPTLGNEKEQQQIK